MGIPDIMVLHDIGPARALAAVGVATSLVVFAHRPADAQEAAPESTPRSPRQIEEIVVTAQKTEQELREVPISMSVMDEDFMVDQAITDYRDLVRFAPNAHVDPGNGLFPDINVRGFGSALSNKAFEQSVGLNIDGVPYGRTGYFQGPLFDLERVEVLRGPQGTLFGRNTTAGLLNVVTKKPTDELTGHLAAEFGTLDRRRFEAAIGGPLLANVLNFRLSGLSDERDGLVENTTAAVAAGANERMNSRDRKAARFQLALPDVLGASFNFGYEHIDFDHFGIGWEADRIPEQVKPFYREYDPNMDFVRKNWIGSVDTVEFNRNEIDTLVANAGYQIGIWNADATFGYSFLKVRSLIDDDFGPAPMLFNTSEDDNPQTTTEVRVNSTTVPGFLGLARDLLGTTELNVGFFYQHRKLGNSELAIDFNLPVLARFAAFNNSPPGTPIGPLEDFIGPAVLIEGLGVLDTTATHEQTLMRFKQVTDSYAGFGQIDWHFLPRWTIQSGMRITDETKEALWDRSVGARHGGGLRSARRRLGLRDQPGTLGDRDQSQGGSPLQLDG